MIACTLACGYAQQLFVCVGVDSRNFIDKKPGHTRKKGRRKIWKANGVTGELMENIGGGMAAPSKSAIGQIWLGWRLK